MVSQNEKEEDKVEAIGALGVERWVQFAYFLSVVTLAWFLIRSTNAIWRILADTVDIVSEPNNNWVMLSSGAIALIIGFITYRSIKIYRFVTAVCMELSKVTWPTRKETWAQTLIVLVVSAIAAVILGIFDGIWSKVTDMIYNV